MKKHIIMLIILVLILLFASCTYPTENPSDSEGTTADQRANQTENSFESVSSQETILDVEGVETLEKVHCADTETPWYLTEWETNISPKFFGNEAEKPIPSEKESVAVKVPLTYETNVSGISFAAEFFQVYYRIGDLIQVRYTFKNQTEQDFLFESTHGCPRIIFRAEDEERSIFRDVYLYYFPNEPTDDAKPYYSYEYYLEDDEKHIVIPAGQTLVLEYAYYADSDFFDAEHQITAEFLMYGAFLENGETQPFTLREFDFGTAEIDLVEVAWVKPS